MKKWSEILSFLMAPQLEYVQVGVTSHCNALCIYCPKAVYKKKWQNSHLSIATFEKLLPDLRRTKFVHLQGWGEPLLNPQFFKMVEKLKALGHSVGTTSNAGLWNDEISRQIVEQNVDLVAFSLAGTSDGQDKIRCGTSLSQVITAIKSLQAAKRIHKTNKPSVHIAYMLLRSGMEEVRFLPDLINGLGINQVVISVLDFVPEASLVSECIMPKDYAEEKEIKNYLSEIVEKGKKFGIEIFYRLISPSRKLGRCSENISNATYIAPDGEVSPCAYTNIPVIDGSYAVDCMEKPYQRITFGNINDEPLWKIWHSKAYVEFRKAHEQLRPPETCRNCPKLFI